MLTALALTIFFTQPTAPPDTSKPAAAPVPISESLSPFVGHVGTTEAYLWTRVPRAGRWSARLWDVEKARDVETHTEVASAEHDLTLHFRFSGLHADRAYQVYRAPESSIATPAIDADPGLASYPFADFRTRKDPSTPQSVTLVIGSCQHDDFAKPQPIWDEMAKLKPDANLLIGDTPYIDSTDLAVQRRRYREFFTIPQLAALCRTVPTYGIWDDHDFGRNDTDGNLKGKEHARQAFGEYHANAPTGSGDGMGENNLGTYSTFRIGPVEVWLIDARWFASTEKTFAPPPDNDKPSLIGKQQWAWLQRGLKASTAPFKLLVTGMVWNDEVRAGKKDYWGTYPYERTAVFEFLQANHIEGVVVVGGDIHRNRAYKHGKAFSHLDYPLYEVVTSPYGSKVMKQGEGSPATVPDMLYDAADLRTFAAITCDSTKSPATLVVRWLNDQGKELYRIETTAKELSFPTGSK